MPTALIMVAILEMTLANLMRCDMCSGRVPDSGCHRTSNQNQKGKTMKMETMMVATFCGYMLAGCGHERGRVIPASDMVAIPSGR